MKNPDYNCKPRNNILNMEMLTKIYITMCYINWALKKLTKKKKNSGQQTEEGILLNNLFFTIFMILVKNCGIQM